MMDIIARDTAEKTAVKLDAHLDDYATLKDSLFIEEDAEWEENDN